MNLEFIDIWRDIEAPSLSSEGGLLHCEQRRGQCPYARRFELAAGL